MKSLALTALFLAFGSPAIAHADTHGILPPTPYSNGGEPAPVPLGTGTTMPYPADPDRPVSVGVPGGLRTPSYEWSMMGGSPGTQTARGSIVPGAPSAVPQGVLTTPPTAPFMGGLSQGPTSWGMAAQNLLGYPPGWFGFGWGGTSIFGLGGLDTGQGDTHPATVPYPAMFP